MDLGATEQRSARGTANFVDDNKSKGEQTNLPLQCAWTNTCFPLTHTYISTWVPVKHRTRSSLWRGKLPIGDLVEHLDAQFGTTAIAPRVTVDSSITHVVVLVTVEIS
jgi:hypothetical protein